LVAKIKGQLERSEEENTGLEKEIRKLHALVEEKDQITAKIQKLYEDSNEEVRHQKSAFESLNHQFISNHLNTQHNSVNTATFVDEQTMQENK